MRESRHEGPTNSDDGQSAETTDIQTPESRYYLTCTDCGYETTFRGDGIGAIEHSSVHEAEMAGRGVGDHVVEIAMIEAGSEAAAESTADGGVPVVQPTEWAKLSRRVSPRVSSARRRGGAD